MGGQLGVAIAMLLVVLAVAGLEGVDTASVADRTCARATATRLAGLASGPPPAALGELRAGFGRLVLTPQVGAAADAPERGEFRALPLAGYGNRQGRPAAGVHDELWVKAVALAAGGSTGVVVAADALIIPREVAEEAALRVWRERGLDRGRIYFGATHTHCSLGGWGEGWVGEAFAGGFQPGARRWMAERLAGAVVAALDDLAPAALGHGSFAAPEFIRNRLVGDEGRVDPAFSLLVVRQEEGDQAVLGSYSAHATVLPGSFMHFSGDYPGFWQRAVESAAGGMAVFLAGGVGSHSPRAPGGGIEGARAMGEALAQRTTMALPAIALTNRLIVGCLALPVDLPELQARITDAVRLRPWVAQRLLPVRADCSLQAFRLGRAVWLSTPCDYSGEMALDLKAAARDQGLDAVVTSFNGDYVGYVVPEKYYHLDTYETRTMSFFGPQLPGYFDGLLRGLIAAVARPPEAPGQP